MRRAALIVSLLCALLAPASGSARLADRAAVRAVALLVEEKPAQPRAQKTARPRTPRPADAPLPKSAPRRTARLFLTNRSLLR